MSEDNKFKVKTSKSTTAVPMENSYANLWIGVTESHWVIVCGVSSWHHWMA